MTSLAFSFDVSDVAELMMSLITLNTAASFSPSANRKRYSAENIVERASIREDSRFTFLMPVASCELSAEPVRYTTPKESKTVEIITLVASELRRRKKIRFIV